MDSDTLQIAVDLGRTRALLFARAGARVAAVAHDDGVAEVRDLVRQRHQPRFVAVIERQIVPAGRSVVQRHGTS